MQASAEQRFLQFMYLIPVGLIETERDGRVVTLNPLATQTMIMLSGSPDLSNAFRSFASAFPDLAERVERHEGFGAVIDNERFEHAPKAGDARNFSLTLHVVSEERLAFVVSDITALVAQERETRRREAELRTLVNSVHTHMFVSVDTDGHIQSHNASIERLTGRGVDATGQDVGTFFVGDVDVEQLGQQAAANGWAEVEGEMYGPDDTRWWGRAVYTRIVDERERTTGYAMVVREDSARHAREEQLEEWACKDPLTGLSTRRAFESALAVEIDKAKASDCSVAFVLVDVDHFKSVNDTYGHQAGDDVLVELAARIRETVRSEDLVVRMGGEEFGVLLIGAGADKAEMVSERLRNAVASKPFPTVAGELSVTISGGVCRWKHGESKFDTVYAAADKALYEAKESGRNRFVHC